MPLNVEDRLAVQDVVILYGHLHDSMQMHRIPDEIFTADATIDFGTGQVTGRDGIRAFFSGFEGLLGTSHIITNLIVDGDGDDARCQSHCLAWHWMKKPDVDGRPSLPPADNLAVGGYQDVFRRENDRSEEHTSELQSLMRISYAVFCLKKKKNT